MNVRSQIQCMATPMMDRERFVQVSRTLEHRIKQNPSIQTSVEALLLDISLMSIHQIMPQHSIQINQIDVSETMNVESINEHE